MQVAPLVFAKLFFPHSDPLVGTMEAFGIYAVGFISRPVGGRAVRPLRRPHRPQGDLDRDPAVDRSVDLRGRLRPRLCRDRGLGRGDPDRRALHPGNGDRRRIERRDVDRDGMGKDQQASRLHHLLAAMGRTGRAVVRQSGSPDRQQGLWRSVLRLGLAGTVLVQYRHSRHRDHPTWHPRNAGVQARRRGGARRASST